MLYPSQTLDFHQLFALFVPCPYLVLFYIQNSNIVFLFRIQNKKNGYLFQIRNKLIAITAPITLPTYSYIRSSTSTYEVNVHDISLNIFIFII